MRDGWARARVLSDGAGRVIIYDPPLLDRPTRPCARCARAFQPTARRRMMCAPCFRHATDDPPTYPLRLTSSLR